MTLTSRSAGSLMVECSRTKAEARSTPGAAATASVVSAGTTVDAVNGPDVPSATIHESAPMTSTMRRISLWSVALNPAIKRVIANVSAVAAIAIVKRRRRNCRSLRLMSHMAPVTIR